MAKIVIMEEVCKGCGLCVRICPKKVIVISEKLNAQGFHPAAYTGEGCIGCKSCALTCPDSAIEVFK
ncbi:MAG: ferredoxin family protein [Candidatus Wallbacteria bacterium]|nr:ferredoxin family protein [Candidatus Wallbacteria bacterium]